MGVVSGAAEQKARGEQVSRARSLAAATVAGLTAGVITYRLLRSA